MAGDVFGKNIYKMTLGKSDIKIPVILLSCVDAGSANLLLPLLINSEFNFNIYASGIAAKIIQDAGLSFHLIEEDSQENLVLSIELIFDQLRPDILVCGTSWGMTIDKIMTLIAKKRGILSISMIDHWTLFRQRYCDTDKSDYKDDLKYLTDYCIVIDEKSRILAEKEGIDSARLLVGGHPHLEVLESKSIPYTREFGNNHNRNNNLLYISEKIRDHLGRFGHIPYDEYDVLDDLCVIADKLNMSLDVKLHPQENQDKFTNMNHSTHTPQNIFKELSFESMLHNYDFIIGMDSMLLIELGLFRGNVVSYRPKYDGVFHLHDTLLSVLEFNDINTLECYITDSAINDDTLGNFTRDYRRFFDGSTQRITKLLSTLIIDNINNK